jgi:hypothetical protein
LQVALWRRFPKADLDLRELVHYVDEHGRPFTPPHASRDEPAS